MDLFGNAIKFGDRCRYCNLCDILRSEKESAGEIVSIADCHRHRVSGPAYRKRIAEHSKHRKLDPMEQSEHSRAQRANMCAPPEDQP